MNQPQPISSVSILDNLESVPTSVVFVSMIAGPSDPMVWAEEQDHTRSVCLHQGGFHDLLWEILQDLGYIEPRSTVE